MRRPFYMSVILALVTGLALFAFTENLWLAAASALLVVIAAISYGATHVRSGFFMTLFHRAKPGQKTVALTFDDGPCEHTGEIISVLEKHGIQATFFLIGHKVAAFPHMVQQLHEAGHTLGNHTWSHSVWFDFWSSQKMQQDILQASEAIQSVTGEYPRYFRPPYGVTNPPLARAVKKTGLIPVGWSLRSLDTQHNDRIALKKKILSRLRDGDVILFHDTTPGLATLLNELIPEITGKGYTFVTMDTMITPA